MLSRLLALFHSQGFFLPLPGEFSKVADKKEGCLLMTGSTCFERLMVETERLSASPPCGCWSSHGEGFPMTTGYTSAPAADSFPSSEGQQLHGAACPPPVSASSSLLLHLSPPPLLLQPLVLQLLLPRLQVPLIVLLGSLLSL